MQQIPARSDNSDIIQHSDQPTIVQNQHLTSDVVWHKSLLCFSEQLSSELQGRGNGCWPKALNKQEILCKLLTIIIS